MRRIRNTNARKVLCGVAAAALATGAAAGALVATATDAPAAMPSQAGAQSAPKERPKGDLPPAVTRFDGKPYKVYPSGKVDFATYRGYNLFGNVCGHCHGLAANGTSFGPSLVKALRHMSYDKFVATVFGGITNISSSSTKVMPAFGDNPSVQKYIDSIYAYLKGRADGAVGAGTLQWKGPKDM